MVSCLLYPHIKISLSLFWKISFHSPQLRPWKWLHFSPLESSSLLPILVPHQHTPISAWTILLCKDNQMQCCKFSKLHEKKLVKKYQTVQMGYRIWNELPQPTSIHPLWKIYHKPSTRGVSKEYIWSVPQCTMLLCYSGSTSHNAQCFYDDHDQFSQFSPHCRIHIQSSIILKDTVWIAEFSWFSSLFGIFKSLLSLDNLNR